VKSVRIGWQSYKGLERDRTLVRGRLQVPPSERHCYFLLGFVVSDTFHGAGVLFNSWQLQIHFRYTHNALCIVFVRFTSYRWLNTTFQFTNFEVLTAVLLKFHVFHVDS